MSSRYRERRPNNGWQRLASFRHPSKFQRVWRTGFVTEPMSFNGGQSHFTRCLAVFWAATLCIHFRAVVPWRNSAKCKFHFASKSSVNLYWQRYCTALEQWASAKLCSVVSSRVRAAIPFNIGRSNGLVFTYSPPSWILLYESFGHPRRVFGDLCRFVEFCRTWSRYAVVSIIRRF